MIDSVHSLYSLPRGGFAVRCRKPNFPISIPQYLPRIFRCHNGLQAWLAYLRINSGGDAARLSAPRCVTLTFRVVISRIIPQFRHRSRIGTFASGPVFAHSVSLSIRTRVEPISSRLARQYSRIPVTCRILLFWLIFSLSACIKRRQTSGKGLRGGRFHWPLRSELDAYAFDACVTVSPY
jgi:hypothetical protein